ncbi:MAG: hypothetical protein V4676_04040, partial [Bacteroidota bacterium]
MRSFYLNALLFSFFQLLMVAAFSQAKLPAEVEVKLKGKKKFYEIKSIIQNYFTGELRKLPMSDVTRRNQISREMKMWNRSFFEAESRLNANGEVENTSKKVFEFLNGNPQAAARTS